MWNTIKKYYLLTFVGFFMATAIKTFLNESKNSFVKNSLITFVTAFAISLIAGTLYYFQDTKWGPNKRNKMFTKKPFSDLFMNGFIQKGDTAVGTINRYTIIVNYVWPNGVSAILVNVLFDKNTTANISDIKKRNKSIWGEDVIGKLLTYNFTPPSYEKVLSAAEAMTSILKAEGLPPTGYEDKSKLAAGELTNFAFVG
jgi:hypothetical protein